MKSVRVFRTNDRDRREPFPLSDVARSLLTFSMLSQLFESSLFGDDDDDGDDDDMYDKVDDDDGDDKDDDDDNVVSGDNEDIESLPFR